MPDELAYLDATAQAELVRAGDVSPLELVNAAIDRIGRHNDDLNAVITERFDKACQEAAAADLPQGPFRGVPFLMKDLDACTKDDPFHCGMQFLKDRNYISDHDSHFYAQVRAAGFITLGKTNTPEFGLSITTEPDAYGSSRNPWNLLHSTGGSSGGSGAAVAAGLVPAAHASDGGGSIRIPASECGLVGLKPSRGRVSLGPDYDEYWQGLVISHVVTRTVRDTAAMLDCVSGVMTGDPYSAPLTEGTYSEQVRQDPGALRIGLVRTVPGRGTALAADCVAAVDAAGRALEDCGHRVEIAHPGAMNALAETMAAFQVIVASWTAAAVEEWTGIIGATPAEGDLEPGTLLLAEIGRGVSATDYIASAKWIGRYTREMASWWSADDGAGFDVLVTPTLGGPPPEIGYLKATDDNAADITERVMGLLPFTVPFNLTGQPAMSLPLHWNTAGLPIGVQFAGAYGREDVLIRLAAQLEQALPWADKRPPVYG